MSEDEQALSAAERAAMRTALTLYPAGLYLSGDRTEEIATCRLLVAAGMLEELEVPTTPAGAVSFRASESVAVALGGDLAALN